MAQKEYFLIGPSNERIRSRNPPTLRKLLQNVVYENMEKKVPLGDSVKLVIKNAMVLWKHYGIETIRSDHCEEKLEKEYMDWQRLYRNRHLQSESQTKKRDALKAKLDLEFDVKRKRTYTKKVAGANNLPETQSIEPTEMKESESVHIEENVPVETQQIEKQASFSEGTKKRQSGIQTRAQSDEIVESKCSADYIYYYVM